MFKYSDDLPALIVPPDIHFRAEWVRHDNSLRNRRFVRIGHCDKPRAACGQTDDHDAAWSLATVIDLVGLDRSRAVTRFDLWRAPRINFGPEILAVEAFFADRLRVGGVIF